MNGVAQIDRYAPDRKPSFVDLRDFALASQAKVVARGDYLSSRAALYENGLNGPVGAIVLDSASGIVESMVSDEFVLVLKGELTLGATVLGKGDAAIIAHGTGFVWSAAADTLAVYLRYPESTPSGAGITAISKDPAYVPSNKPSPDVLIGPAPECRNFNDYRVDEGRFVCGTWASTAYRRHGFPYGHYEIMHLVKGSVTLEDAGLKQTFQTGATVLAERGSHCAWDSREDVAKLFAIYRAG